MHTVSTMMDMDGVLVAVIVPQNPKKKLTNNPSKGDTWI